MDYQCAQCGSGNIQKIALIHREGIRTYESKTSSDNIANFSDRATKGVSQTEASKGFAPPSKAPYWVAPIVALVLLFSTQWLFKSVFGEPGNFLKIVLGVAFFWLPLIAGIAGTVWFNFFVWPNSKSQWENSYHCNRCGEISVLSKD